VPPRHTRRQRNPSGRTYRFAGHSRWSTSAGNGAREGKKPLADPQLLPRCPTCALPCVRVGGGRLPTQNAEGPFFDERGALRPEAHELLESILLASANCFEERKLPYLAHMYDGVAHDSTVTTGDSLFLARMADQLTFRQLQGLAVFGRHSTGDTALEIDLGKIEADHRSGARAIDPALFEELTDLGNRRLVGAWTGAGRVRDPSATWGGDWEGVAIGQVALTELGKLLHRLMRLDEMPDVDWRSWVVAYRGQAR
jgi:hypothetical protein